ncbi:MAG: SGNH/GDSL hydrolase family protein [Planctomycetes bacterium]|nr:SGNH/GDSL hydrolase family protein [Planctomycetota bacterium]
MPAPSSTSSSEPRRARLPLGGLLALGLVLAADRLVFAEAGLWARIVARLELVPKALVRVELGIARDRVDLARLGQAAPGVARVVLFGNSRANDGFQFREVPPQFELARLTHAPLSPLEFRLCAREVAAAQPALVVALFSEYDTHRPPRIVPRAGFADLRATGGLVLDAVAARGGWEPAFAFEKRVELERLGLAVLFNAYRYRDVLERAWLNDALGFRADDAGRLPTLVSHELDEAPARAPEFQALRARFRRTLGDRYPDATLRQVQDIGVGPHVAANEGLIEAAVAHLRARGCEVLIVEGPLHPLSYELYDHATTRAQFVEFARRLEREHGAHFLALEDSGPYDEGDFSDPLHLVARRGRELGARVLREAAAILDLPAPPRER